MALGIDALHQPLSDYVTARFATPPGSRVVFRLDRFGSSVGEADFSHPDDPTGQAGAVIAREKVSDLVNRVPADAGDGAHVVLTSDSVDGFYGQLLAQSRPFVPTGTDDSTGDALVEAFEAAKAAAQLAWDSSELVSVSGSAVPVHLTDATPTSWYAPADSGWTSASLTIETQGSSQSAAPPVQWRIPPTAAELSPVLTLPRFKMDAALRASLTATMKRGPGGLPHVIGLPRGAVLGKGPAPAVSAPPPADTSVGTFRQHLVDLDVVRRLELISLVEQKAETAPTTTDHVRIHFDCCVVHLRRAWWSSALLTGTSWHVPGRAQGELTRAGGVGALPMLPVGFVAVRNLSITAPWSAEDRAALANAMSWGPFDISSSIGTGEVRQPGLQIVGWLLEVLPCLPPREMTPGGPAVNTQPDPKLDSQPAAVDPDSNPDPQLEAREASGDRTYVVKPGDTLRKIAAAFYGDPTAFARIATANSISDPNKIRVGQRLRIP